MSLIDCSNNLQLFYKYYKIYNLESLFNAGNLFQIYTSYIF